MRHSCSIIRTFEFHRKQVSGTFFFLSHPMHTFTKPSLQHFSSLYCGSFSIHRNVSESAQGSITSFCVCMLCINFSTPTESGLFNIIIDIPLYKYKGYSLPKFQTHSLQCMA